MIVIVVAGKVQEKKLRAKKRQECPELRARNVKGEEYFANEVGPTARSQEETQVPGHAVVFECLFC
jgi:hypothetical protein